MSTSWFGLLGLALGFALGIAFCLLSTRLRRTRSRPDVRPVSGLQLLRWIDAGPVGWLMIDAFDRVRLINPRAERLLGCEGSALGPAEPLDRVCPAPEIREGVTNARHQQRPQRLEWQVRDETLEVFALPGDDGWVALTVQSRRSLEAQLEQQERWVSDVAHELKTPLTALLLVGDSLASQATEGNAVLVERLQRELRRLEQLVGDLLELSRLENVLPDDERFSAPVDLVTLLDQVWMGLRPVADQRRIRLEVEAPPMVRVRGDGSRLHRALLNLLDNAVRYTHDDGTVQVDVQPGDEWCLLTVRDQGPGLSEEDLAHMFERFYRGDPSRGRHLRAGSGLGLAIVQQIALAHGGRVQARNHPEGGAALELLLPAMPGEPA